MRKEKKNRAYYTCSNSYQDFSDDRCLNRPRTIFAGGIVVHINAGVAALALVLVLGVRKGVGKEEPRAHFLPLALIGTGILWSGWFGFNAGSALGANHGAINAMVTTQIGAACGAVAGLVAITPAAGFVGPLAAFVFGVLAGVVCYAAVSLKFRFGYDDSLDVVGVHLVGGIVGSLLAGVLAQASVGGVDGALFGNFAQV